MRARINYNKKTIVGDFTESKGKTGIPPGRRVFKTDQGSEYYPEQITILEDEKNES